MEREEAPATNEAPSTPAADEATATDEAPSTPAAEEAAAEHGQDAGGEELAVGDVRSIFIELSVEDRRAATQAANVPWRSTSNMPKFDGCGPNLLRKLYDEASKLHDAMQGD